jgi:hypothetical protein
LTQLVSQVAEVQQVSKVPQVSQVQQVSEVQVGRCSLHLSHVHPCHQLHPSTCVTIRNARMAIPVNQGFGRAQTYRADPNVNPMERSSGLKKRP